MIPSELFFDLVDAQVSFRVKHHEYSVGGIIYDVSRATAGKMTLSLAKTHTVNGSADQILARINALLCRQYDHCAPRLELDKAPCFRGGKNYTVSIIPEKRGQFQAFGGPVEFRCRLEQADDPDAVRQKVLAEVTLAERTKLYSMQLLDSNRLVELSRHSAHALPARIRAMTTTRLRTLVRQST